MELLFLIFTILTGIAEGVFLIWGYISHCSGLPEAKWIKSWKLALFCGFFACWFLWNIFRNF
ncbi:MAG: hypothetical protein J6B86_06170 [Clostridia bacterium]|nr:hypothetical protein [Clostridia bacterium]